MNNKSIVTLIFWYGPYPWYFSYFIHSCGHNLSIDFLLVTDNKEVIPNKPQNIKLVYMTIEEIINIASQNLGFEVNIPRPYKICDFRPAFGIIFPDFIKGYDFWSTCDIDMVFGNIRSFITDEILETYDIISCRHDYLTGTFCLYKNNDTVNTLYEKSRDYQEAFTSPEHYCFDEAGFLYDELRSGHSILEYPDSKQCMTYAVRKEEAEGRLKPYFDFIILEGLPSKNIKWENGRIIYNDSLEAIYFHLINFKKICINPKVFNPIPEMFYFTPKTIKTKNH